MRNDVYSVYLLQASFRIILMWVIAYYLHLAAQFCIILHWTEGKEFDFSEWKWNFIYFCNSWIIIFLEKSKFLYKFTPIKIVNLYWLRCCAEKNIIKQTACVLDELAYTSYIKKPQHPPPLDIRLVSIEPNFLWSLYLLCRSIYYIEFDRAF